MVTLSAPIAAFARQEPDRPAIQYDDLIISYGALYERVLRLAAMMASRGVAPGDRVALLMKNSPAFVEIACAASHIGAVHVPINFRLAADEVAYILDHAGASLLFVDAELTDRAGDFGAATVVDSDAQRDSRRLASAADPIAPWPSAPDDLMRLMYTSGTTSRPKGVMHSYANVMWKNAGLIGSLGLSGQDRLLVSGPLYHAGAGELPGAALLVLGGSLCILRDFGAEAALAAIARHGITGGWMAPVMVGAVLNEAAHGSYDASSLRWITSGGDRTPEPRIRAFAEAFPGARFVDAYGLTETCAGDTVMEPGREIEKIGSTGRAIPYVEIEIRDEGGAVLPADREGEICLRGPKVTRGYWRDEDATQAAFHDGGWFRSGDVGRLDADGFLYLTDRRKDMIISGGENIASSELERVIDELPAVAEVAVIGVADEKWGEVPAAVVVLRDGARLDLAALEAHCRRHLAGFKVPKALFERDTLPRNASGKILKRVLRDEYDNR